MNKNFIKAIAMTAAIIMAQSTAVGVSAATTQTATVSSISATSSTKSSVSKYNNNKGYTALDKWGNAYPYSYYYYAEQSTEKGKEYILEDYLYLYNYLHENRYNFEKGTVRVKIKMNNADTKAEYKTICAIARKLCDSPTLYFLQRGVVNCTRDSNDKSYIVITFKNLFTSSEIKDYDKKLAAVNKDFNSFLKKNNAKNASDFYHCVLDYIVDNVEYNDTIPNSSQTAVGALLEHETNCAGYTEAYSYLCCVNQMPYAETAGYISKRAHGWSKVPIKNVWYVVDSTNAEYYPEASFVFDKKYEEIMDAVENTVSTVYPAADGKAVTPKLPSVIPDVSESRSSSASTGNAIKAANGHLWGFGNAWIYKDVNSAYENGYDCVYAKILDKESKSKKDRIKALKEQFAELKEKYNIPVDHYVLKNDVFYVYLTQESFDVSISKAGNGMKAIDPADFYSTYAKTNKTNLAEQIEEAIAYDYSYLTVTPLYDKDENVKLAKENVEQAKKDGLITYDNLEIKNDTLYIYFASSKSSSDNSKKATSSTLKDEHLKSYDAFTKQLKSAVKKAEDGGYGYLTLKSSKTKTLEKYLKQAKKDGIVSYSSLKAVEGGIRIKF